MPKLYLLEIGMEELPARYVRLTLEQIKAKMKSLVENDISYSEIAVYSTPRRLTAMIKNPKEGAGTAVEEIKGPAEKIAFNDGVPSKALEGFMRSQGVSVEDIEIKDGPNGRYCYAKVTKKSKPLKEIIKNGMPELIKSISFPKSMRWGGKSMRFVRPIRWIVSMLDDEVLDFDLCDIPVGRETRGHRFLGSSSIVLNNASEYMEKLEDNFCIVDNEKRYDMIKYGAAKLAREVGGIVDPDDDLMEEISNIVEYPTPLRGEIGVEYLKLPKEVVTTPLKDHQRYLPVLNAKGALLPYFITVRNGNEEHLDIVAKGNEKVLGARLEDAKFFFNEDTSRPFEDYVSELENITFHEKLGSLKLKTARLVKLSQKLAEYLDVPEETKQHVRRSANLSKADLTTKLVIEFTELQGVMGREYAKLSGEEPIVYNAIFEQYLPRFAGDKIPESTAGAILSIADKIDTLVGMFAIGICPTGSEDPFGLRRSAIGIISVILEKKLNFSLNDIIEYALYTYVEENGLVFDDVEVKKGLREFFEGRIKSLMQERGVRYDLIDALISSDSSFVVDLFDRAEIANEFFKQDRTNMLEAYRRVGKLVDKAENYEIHEDVLQREDMQLLDRISFTEKSIKEAQIQRDYGEILHCLEELSPFIHKYFEDVMIMDKNEKLKSSRLSIMKKLYDISTAVIDMKKVVE